MKKEEIINDLNFNPHDDKVLGVFDDHVHVRIMAHNYSTDKEYHAILIIPIKEYQKAWFTYLKGKQSICKVWGHYCGVWGGIDVLEAKEDKEIILLDFNPDNDPQDESTWFQIEVPARTFLVSKLGDYADFEHG